MKDKHNYVIETLIQKEGRMVSILRRSIWSWLCNSEVWSPALVINQKCLGCGSGHQGLPVNPHDRWGEDDAINHADTRQWWGALQEQHPFSLDSGQRAVDSISSLRQKDDLTSHNWWKDPPQQLDPLSVKPPRQKPCEIQGWGAKRTSLKASK